MEHEENTPLEPFIPATVPQGHATYNLYTCYCSTRTRYTEPARILVLHCVTWGKHATQNLFWPEVCVCVCVTTLHRNTLMLFHPTLWLSGFAFSVYISVIQTSTSFSKPHSPNLILQTSFSTSFSKPPHHSPNLILIILQTSFSKPPHHSPNLILIILQTSFSKPPHHSPQAAEALTSP